MAIPRVSKMVTHRQRLCEFVERFVQVHREEVAEALALYLHQIGDPAGQDPGTPDVKAFLDRLRGRLKEALRQLLQAEQRHLDELADDAEPRKRKERTTAELSQDVFQLRDLFRGAYGRSTAEEVIGFERRIAYDPAALARQSERVAARLRDPGLSLPPPRFEWLEISVEGAAATLEGKLERLRAATVDVTRNRSRAKGSKLVKDQAINGFDKAYRPIVKLLRAAFRLAGKPELAARIPSLRRRPRRKA